MHRPAVPVLVMALVAGLVQAEDDRKDEEITNSIGMKLRRIEPGEFLMGQGDGPPKTRREFEQRDEDEAPAHKVVIGKAFYLGTYEVTNAQYERFDAEHRKRRGKDGATKEDDEPVTFVTWQQAVD